ncbi:hypothetical protein FNF31_06377 [Cafeteria roenbergensis]|uniref:Cyclic nucleotide-binding domain-containing protein n=1 Tax=Cafeteria roenbergensis TaxID=33653 RepID=A0A5A8CLR1_CAFRO|nr:hypothetical protein FNF31_06377 [Cafeteria roenbergensis]
MSLSRVEHLVALLQDQIELRTGAEAESTGLRRTATAVGALLTASSSMVASSADEDGAAAPASAAGSVASDSASLGQPPTVQAATEAVRRIIEAASPAPVARGRGGTLDSIRSAFSGSSSQPAAPAAPALDGPMPSQLEVQLCRSAVRMARCLATMEEELLQAKLRLADSALERARSQEAQRAAAEATAARLEAALQREKDAAAQAASQAAQALAAERDATQAALSRAEEAERSLAALRAANADMQADFARLRMAHIRGGVAATDSSQDGEVGTPLSAAGAEARSPDGAQSPLRIAGGWSSAGSRASGGDAAVFASPAQRPGASAVAVTGSSRASGDSGAAAARLAGSRADAAAAATAVYALEGSQRPSGATHATDAESATSSATLAIAAANAGRVRAAAGLAGGARTATSDRALGTPTSTSSLSSVLAATDASGDVVAAAAALRSGTDGAPNTATSLRGLGPTGPKTGPRGGLGGFRPSPGGKTKRRTARRGQRPAALRSLSPSDPERAESLLLQSTPEAEGGPDGAGAGAGAGASTAAFAASANAAAAERARRALDPGARGAGGPGAAGGGGSVSTTPLAARALAPGRQSFRMWSTSKSGQGSRLAAASASAGPTSKEAALKGGAAAELAAPSERAQGSDSSIGPSDIEGVQFVPEVDLADSDRAIRSAAPSTPQHTRKPSSRLAKITAVSDEGGSQGASPVRALGAAIRRQPAQTSAPSTALKPHRRRPTLEDLTCAARASAASPGAAPGAPGSSTEQPASRSAGGKSRQGSTPSTATDAAAAAADAEGEDDVWAIVERGVLAVPLFNRFDQHERALLVSSLQHAKFGDGDVVFRQGERAPDAFFIVVSGTIALLPPLFREERGKADSSRPRALAPATPSRRLGQAEWFVGSGIGACTAVARGDAACMMLPDGVLGQLLHWFEGTRRMKATAARSVQKASVPGSPQATPATSLAAKAAAGRIRRRLHRKRAEREHGFLSPRPEDAGDRSATDNIVMLREALAGVSTLPAYAAVVRGLLGTGRSLVVTLAPGRFDSEAAVVSAAIASFASAALAVGYLEEAMKPRPPDASSSGVAGAMDTLSAARTSASKAVRASFRAEAKARVSRWPVTLPDLRQAMQDLGRESGVIVNGYRLPLRSKAAVAGLVAMLAAAVSGSAEPPAGAADGETASANDGSECSTAAPSAENASSAAEAARASCAAASGPSDGNSAAAAAGGASASSAHPSLTQRREASAVAAVREQRSALAEPLRGVAAATRGMGLGSARAKLPLAMSDGAARVVADALVACTRTHSGGDAYEIVFSALTRPGLVRVAAEPAGASECEVLTAGDNAVRVISANAFRLVGVAPCQPAATGVAGDLAGTAQGLGLAPATDGGRGTASLGSAGGSRTIGIIRTTMEERIEYVPEAEVRRGRDLPSSMRAVLQGAQQAIRGTRRPALASYDPSVDGSTAEGDSIHCRPGVAGTPSGRIGERPATLGPSPRRGDLAAFRSAGGIRPQPPSDADGPPRQHPARSRGASATETGLRIDGGDLLGATTVARAQDESDGSLDGILFGSDSDHEGGLEARTSSPSAGSVPVDVSRRSSAATDDPQPDLKGRIRGIGPTTDSQVEVRRSSSGQSRESLGSRFATFLRWGKHGKSRSRASDVGLPQPGKRAAEDLLEMEGEARRTGNYAGLLAGEGPAGARAQDMPGGWPSGVPELDNESGSEGDGAPGSGVSGLQRSRSGAAGESGAADEGGDDEDEDEDEDELGLELAAMIDAATGGAVEALIRGAARSPLRAVRVRRTLRLTFSPDGAR